MAELVVALDNLKVDEVWPVVEEMKSARVKWLKVGLELFSKAGPDLVSKIKKQGFEVFLDLKLYDIPNTVAKAVSAAVETGADLLTIHCSGGPEMMKAAVAATNNTQLKLLGVTVLTSFSDADIAVIGEAWGEKPRSNRSEIALNLANAAAHAGVHGIVCSVSDLQSAKLKSFFTKPLFVTPGIRNMNDATNDQKSVATIADALSAGSTHLVIGRPILSPAKGSRADAAKAALKEIEGVN